MRAPAICSTVLLAGCLHQDPVHYSDDASVRGHFDFRVPALGVYDPNKNRPIMGAPEADQDMAPVFRSSYCRVFNTGVDELGLTEWHLRGDLANDSCLQREVEIANRKPIVINGQVVKPAGETNIPWDRIRSLVNETCLTVIGTSYEYDGTRICITADVYDGPRSCTDTPAKIGYK